jgi:prepilin-type N-terminal cleavage/methylation domain-containing protein
METMRRNNRAGFTLIELMIVVAIIAIISSIAIPRLMSARLSANEAAAISALRSIATAQAQLQSSGAIDTDADGTGEYGFFGELAGADPVRIPTGVPAVPGAGTVGTDELVPSILSTQFGNVAASVVVRQGYVFQIWLPAATAGGLVGAVAEAPNGGSSATFPNSNNGEIMWCAYAWPIETNKTGNRAFFTSHEGELLQCMNRSLTPYDGAVKMPGFSEAFSTPGDMHSALRIGVIGGADNTIWTPVQM